MHQQARHFVYIASLRLPSLVSLLQTRARQPSHSPNRLQAFLYENNDWDDPLSNELFVEQALRDAPAKHTEFSNTRMKIRRQGKKVVSKLLGRRNKSSRQLADHDIDITMSAPRGDAPSVGSEYRAVDVDMDQPGSFFKEAHHMVITNPTMVDKSTNIVNHVASDREARAKKLLSKHIIVGAAHDSSAREPPPQCHPGTRIQINEGILAWFYDRRKRELVLWIYGPAGVGKSAIVQTIAEALAAAKCLGASVFFSRPNGRNNSRAVFITVAYQLAVHIEAYCLFISDKLASDPELVNKGMKEQFNAFIVEPFVEKKIGAGGKTWGILLDGLDELDDRRWQREIIVLITTFCSEHPDVPLAWIIASRPEPHITTTFEQKHVLSSYREQYVPIDSPEACQDVERYLRSSFETMHEHFSYNIVPQDWPEETKFVKLAHAASGLFAFADVAVRYIEDPRHADPVTRLDDVLSVIDRSRVNSPDDQPFAHLDAMYTRILSSIPSKTWLVTRRVLGAILRSYYDLASAKGISVIYGLEISKIYGSMNDLYSVLNIPVDIYSVFEFHHASFSDFLEDVTRSKEFYISPEDTWRGISGCCLKIWLDFKSRSPQGPSSEYMIKWFNYASQYHPDASLPVEVSNTFNDNLIYYIHDGVLASLREMHRVAHTEEGSQHDHDQFLDVVCQIDAAAMHNGWVYQTNFVKFWFDIWKTCREELTRRGIACKIQLGQLQLDHLKYPDPFATHSWQRSAPIPLTDPEEHREMPPVAENFDEYISGLKYIQQGNPELPVIICGTPGNRLAVFMYDYTEDDFKTCPLHTGNESPDFDEYMYHGYYCIAYPDNV